MRRLFQGRVGLVVAFVLGLAIAGAATAGASSLITGGQIKNGTISAKDLSKGLRKQLKRAGPRGLAGPKGVVGPKGDAGPLTTTLPVGQTLRGAFNLDATAAAANVFSGSAVSFGFSLRAAPKTVVVPRNGSPTSECPGTVGAPQATSGIACFYLSSTTNLQPELTPDNFPDGFRVFNFPDTSGAQTNVFGAEVAIVSAAAGRFFADGTWAVTGN